ncbi:RNA helicase [Deerpox virus W-1170-84]|uniref:RNA helicase NPH-II n=1 Tax=Deerpox virus (strain W-1170-84) TaxID=305676 RepID=Q08FC4_DPV84|nr:RNA helicase [Deerpox virus W-1170-84]
MLNPLPNIFYFPNCVNIFSYHYSQVEFDIMNNMDKKRFSMAVYPLIKHRWKNCSIVYNNRTYKLTCEHKQYNTVENKNVNHLLDISIPSKINIKKKEYTIGNIKMSFECYSYIKSFSITDITLFDEYVLRGLLEGGNKLNIFSNVIGNQNDTINIFGNPKPFSKIPLKSLQPDIQNQIFESWISNKPVILTGGTGVGKTSQVPKLLLWFNYLFGGFDNLNILNRNYIQRSIVLSLPRVALVKLHSKTLLKSLGFDQIVGSPITLKFGGIEDEYINTSPKKYGLVLSTHKITLSRLFDYNTIIIDEVHEHDQFGDIIIAIAKKYLDKINSLFLMTATLEDDRDRITEFFKDPIFLHIPGNTLFNISEVYIKNRYSPNDKIRYIEEEKKNILHAINKYTPPKKSSGIIFVSSISQCESYKKYLSEYLNFNIYIIHGKVKNVEEILNSVYNDIDTTIIISTPYLESSVTINNVTHIYDTGRVFLPSPYGGKEIFISKAMREQRKGRVGRVSPGTYIYFFDNDYINVIKRIDYEFLHNYVLYGNQFDLTLPEDLFIIPTDVNMLNKVINYIDSFNISKKRWYEILSSYYVNVLEYAKIYALGGSGANALDNFERNNVLSYEAIDVIKSLNMRAKILHNRKYRGIKNMYIITCKLMFGVYMGKIFNVVHNKPLSGYIIMISDYEFLPDY